MPITPSRGHRDWRLDNRLWALRAAEVGILAGSWLYIMGLWMPFWTFYGTLGLGVSFPFWPVVIVDASAGFVAMMFCAARAWSHQPAILSWLSALLGVGVIVVGALFSVGVYEVLTIAAGALLAVSSVFSALEISGPIFEAPPLTWGEHPIFVSASPTEAELRSVSEDLPADDDPAARVSGQGSADRRSVVGGEGRLARPPEMRGVVGDDAHRHEKPEHTDHVGMKSDESGIEDTYNH